MKVHQLLSCKQDSMHPWWKICAIISAEACKDDPNDYYTNVMKWLNIIMEFIYRLPISFDWSD